MWSKLYYLFDRKIYGLLPSYYVHLQKQIDTIQQLLFLLILFNLRESFDCTD